MSAFVMYHIKPVAITAVKARAMELDEWVKKLINVLQEYAIKYEELVDLMTSEPFEYIVPETMQLDTGDVRRYHGEIKEGDFNLAFLMVEKDPSHYRRGAKFSGGPRIPRYQILCVVMDPSNNATGCIRIDVSPKFACKVGFSTEPGSPVLSALFSLLLDGDKFAVPASKDDLYPDIASEMCLLRALFNEDDCLYSDPIDGEVTRLSIEGYCAHLESIDVEAPASDELPPPPEEVVVPEELLGSKLDDSNGGKAEVTPLPKSGMSIKEVKAFADRNNAALVKSPSDDVKVTLLHSGREVTLNQPALHIKDHVQGNDLTFVPAGTRVIKGKEWDLVQTVEAESFPRGTASDIDAETFDEVSVDPTDFTTPEGKKIAEMFGVDPDRWSAALKYAQEQGVVVLPTRNVVVAPPSHPEDFEGDELNTKAITHRDPVLKLEEIVMPKQSVPSGDDFPIPEGYVKEGDIIDSLNAARVDLSNFLQTSTVISEAVRNRLEGTLTALTTIVVMGTMIPDDTAQFGDAIITAAIVADAVRSPAPRYEASPLDRRERAEDFHEESLRSRDVRNERQGHRRGPNSRY